MKKFLSLVLALVMTMSLVTVSAGAKDFSDSTKIQYKEAVDVMSAVNVISGYAEGDFRPTATLTRGAAAKIICNLILGPTTAGALVADAAPYKDVPTNNTFAGYIAYCQKAGIISGYADGTFKPAQNITRAEAMTLINRVLERKPESPADLLTNMNKWTDNMDTSKWYYLDVQEATNSHGYTRKTFNYELWRQMLPDPDWSRYER